MSQKPDSQEIINYLGSLPSTLGLEPTRAWWPKYVFRFDHIENAAAILNSGRILSRLEAESKGVIVHDSAAQAYIEKLDSTLKNYVRLYFRPRTPTQYANEGIRPKSHIEYDGAHMPVPVFLLFSSRLLTLYGVQFSAGRLATGTSISGSFEFLKNLNFADIYHNTHVPSFESGSSRRSEILNARHSEVLVERELNLQYLNHIVCRSIPERETLLNLLKPLTIETWKDRVHVASNRTNLFFKRATFVEESELNPIEARLRLYHNVRDRSWRGPFELDTMWQFRDKDVRNPIQSDFYVSDERLVLNVPQVFEDYRIHVRLNCDLAYIGDFRAHLDSDIPF